MRLHCLVSQQRTMHKKEMDLSDNDSTQEMSVQCSYL